MGYPGLLHRLCRFSKHRPHSICNLTQCRVSLDRRDDAGYQVFARPRRLFDLIERRHRRSRVAFRPNLLHAFNLRLLEGRINFQCRAGLKNQASKSRGRYAALAVIT